MSQKLNIIFYALIILLILVLPSQADEYCTTEDMCAAAAQAAGKMLGNEGKMESQVIPLYQRPILMAAGTIRIPMRTKTMQGVHFGALLLRKQR